MREVYLFLLGIALVPLVLAAPKPEVRNKEDTALYQYIYRDDGHFSWYLERSERTGSVTTYWLNVTSQKWFDETFSTHPVWWHWVVVHVPDQLNFGEDAAHLYISSGSMGGPPSISSGHVNRTLHIAERLGIVTGVIRQIPNQPIRFLDDRLNRNRTEDALIAWTWRVFLENERDLEGGADPEIIARMPMCKGVVKAMDAMTELVQQERGVTLERFMLAGASKRGWTTWMTGAMDDRVVAMVPIVLSILNMRPNMEHYYQSFGGWPYYFGDYWVENITAWMLEPEIDVLAQYADPYSYHEWMTMPKMAISGASDEFFLPDDFQFFWDDLPGEKLMWLVDDSGHSLDRGPHGEDVWLMIETFFLSVLAEAERPDFTWSRGNTEDGGYIAVQTSTTPANIKAYWADSVVEDRRDWRLKMLNRSALPDGIEQDTNIKWSEENVEDLGDGQYRFETVAPAEGFRAFFIKLSFEALEDREYLVSTEVHIIPDEFPYEMCTTSQECRGRLW